ncbi:MAG: hypothetical protein HKN42_19965 [Granulosicoccus sp.]|nr:hypothetical protein [Granulosicoccus sp.]
MRGAGGSQGGEWLFLAGIVMMIAGFYLLFNAIAVETRFGLGMRLYGVGGVGITSGMLMIPFIAGVVIIFYNAANPAGWLLGAGSLVALVVGVLANSQFSLRNMSAFDLMLILALAFGGLGLFLKSLRHNPL